MAQRRAEPIYQEAYTCPDADCGGWRFKGLADANGVSNCIYCGRTWSKKVVLKAVSQRKRTGPRAGGGKGGGRAAGGAQAASAQSPATRLLQGGAAQDPREVLGPVQAGLQPPRSAGAGGRGKGGSKTGHRAQQPPEARPPWHKGTKDAKLEDLCQMVVIAKRSKGEDSELHKKAAEELAQYEQEQEDRKTPKERVRELQLRLGRQRDVVARASQSLTQAEANLEQARAKVQQAEEDLGDGVRQVEELESDLAAAQALMPQPAPLGEQVEIPNDLGHQHAPERPWIPAGSP